MPMDGDSDGVGPSSPRYRDVTSPESGADALSQPNNVTAEGTGESLFQPEAANDLSWYSDHFDEHIRHTLRHRNGDERLDASKRPHRISMPGWTDHTVSHFFAAVSRHSRLRADLIAMELDLPESEVMAYLDALDEGLAKVYWRVDTETGGVRSKVDGAKRRRVFEEGRAHSVREVSEEWIAKEEELARRVDELVKQRERAIEELERAKQRKAERSEIKREVLTTVTDRAERKAVRHDRFADIDGGWAREDWGRSLDSKKMAQLDKLTRPSWSEWYSRRVHGNDPVRCSSGPPFEDGEDSLDHRPTLETTGKLSKHAKIAIDNAALESLVAIEKSARTPEQRAEIAKLQNRKRNRDNVRLNKLTQEGLSSADIEAKGGVDSAYLSIIGKSIKVERLLPGQITPDHSRYRHASPRKPSQSAGSDRTRRALTGTTTSEDGAALEDLRRIGMFQMITNDSLDMINFTQLASLTTNVEIPLQTIQDVNGKTKAFLRSLVMSAIVIAETERAQCGDQIQLSVEHVRLAMGHSSATLGLADRQPNGDDEPPQDELDSDSDTHELTEDEDFELDVHLDAMDEAMDEDLERRLFISAGYDPPPVEDPVKDLQGAQEGMCNPQDDHYGPVADGSLAYLGVLAKVDKARRHRHSIQQRSILFPSTYYRRNLGQRRKRTAHKTAAIIEDSDSA